MCDQGDAVPSQEEDSQTAPSGCQQTTPPPCSQKGSKWRIWAVGWGRRKKRGTWCLGNQPLQVEMEHQQWLKDAQLLLEAVGNSKPIGMWNSCKRQGTGKWAVPEDSWHSRLCELTAKRAAATLSKAFQLTMAKVGLNKNTDITKQETKE